MEKGDKNYGTAYAFMDLDASIKQVRDELPRVLVAAQTPSELEVSVREVKDLINDRKIDSALVEYIRAVNVKPAGHFNRPSKKMSELKYVVEAKYPNAEDKQAAEQLTDVSNNLCYAFNYKKPFYAEIVAKAPNGRYMSWTND